MTIKLSESALNPQMLSPSMFENDLNLWIRQRLRQKFLDLQKPAKSYQSFTILLKALA